MFDPTERLHFYFKIILVFYNSSCNQVLLSSLNGSLHTVIHIRNKSENMSNKIDYRTKVKLYIPSTLNTDYLLCHTQLIVCAVKGCDTFGPEHIWSLDIWSPTIGPSGQTVPNQFSPHGQMVPKNLVPMDKWSPKIRSPWTNGPQPIWSPWKNGP